MEQNEKKDSVNQFSLIYMYLKMLILVCMSLWIDFF